MPKTYSNRELVAKLLKYDSRFEIYEKRGKGSERLVYHPDIDGRAASYPLKYHRGGDDVRRGHLNAIRRRFKLPKNFF